MARDVVKILTRAVLAAAQEILQLVPSELARESKGKGDFVTEADFASDRVLKAALAAELSGYQILSEEQDTHTIASDRFITIDPLDGTRPFAAGFSEWGIIVSLLEKFQPIAAVMFQPKLSRLVQVERGSGCFVDGVRVKLEQTRPLTESFVGADLVSSAGADHVVALLPHTMMMRATGAAIAGTTELLIGQTAAYVNVGAKVWDLAAPALAVTEAGGCATALDGGPLHWDVIPQRGIFAASEAIKDELASALQHLQALK